MMKKVLVNRREKVNGREGEEYRLERGEGESARWRQSLPVLVQIYGPCVW